MNLKINLKDFTFDELVAEMLTIGEAKYRAGQIYEWLYKGVQSFDEMTNISKTTREKLDKKYFVSRLKILRKQVSKLDGTQKFLFELEDGNTVESVIMKYKYGYSICISSQVGCKMGCKFCASTLGGLVRSLTPGEIADQIIYAEKDLGERIGNVVMMGIGEPLDNFDNVVKFLKNATHPKGLNIGGRHLTISTCGIVPKIYELAKVGIPISLCISLHAPTQAIREGMMPISKRYDISEIIKACEDYIKVTNKRITFEYALASNVNDSMECADTLAKLIGGLMCMVNIIPINEVRERKYKKSTRATEFRDRLMKHGINATIRRELGKDISAACGQLRKQELNKEGM